MPISNTSPYFQLWATGASGGRGLFRVNGDDAGMTGYSLSQFYQNTTDNAGTPAVAEGLYRPSDMVFDTVHGKFFIADSDLAGHNRILQGNIADLLAGNPPALTILYSDGGSGPAVRIDNLEVDPDSGIVYFTHGDNLEKVVYDTPNQVPVLLFNANVTAASSPSGVANPAGSTNNAFNDLVINFDTGEIYLSSTRVVTTAGGDTIQKNFIYQLTGLTPGSGTNAFTFGVANSGTARLLPISPNDDTYNPNPGTTASPAIPANEPFYFPVEFGSIDGLAIDPITNTLYFSTGSILFDHDVNSGTPPILSRGGIFSYALSGNPTGTYTQIFQQSGAGGPQGLLGDLEIDPTTGRWYVTDYTGGTAGAGDEAVWSGNLNGTGTPSLFSLVNDPAGQLPSGLTLNLAPTLVGTETGAAAVEGAGAGSGFSTDAFALTALASGDFENADQTDQLSGAMVRISAGFGGSPGSTERLTIAGTTAGVLGSGIAYAYNAGTGIMTLTGVNSFANYQAALALVAYSISGDNPDNYGASTSRTLSYSVFDGLLLSDEYDSNVAISATNDAPVNTVGGPVALLETDPPAAITGLSVSDVDADPANDAIQVTLSVTLGTIIVSTSVPGGVGAGDVTGNGTNTVTITATQNAINATFAAASGVTYAPGASGVDTLTMTTNDLGQTGAGGAQQDTDLVVITVINVNDPPTAPANNSVATAEDNTSAATMIGAADPDGDSLTYSEKPGFGAANGTVTFDNLNGTFTYTPDADFNGSDSFTILIDDGNGGTAEQVVSVTVTPVNDAPTAPATGSVSTAEDSASAATAIGASDVDGDTLTYSEKPGFGPGNGVVVFNQAAGTFTYTPAPNFNGSDSFTIVIADGNGGTTEQIVSVTVTPVNDAPTAPAANSVSTAEDSASAATAIGAADLDGDTLTYSEKPGFEASNGTVTFNQLDGTFTYIPDANYNGSDSFTILIDDGNGGTTEQVVSVTVTSVNDAPTAPAAGSVSTAEDSASAATAIGASDVDGDTLTYSEKVGAEAANGTVSFNQLNGTYTYTPNANFNGSDSFTILIEDGNGGSTEQVVTVTVTPVNDAPTVAGDGTEAATPIDEDMPSPVGQSVASLFGGQYSDAADQVSGGSSADAFAGIAVTANGSNPAQGQWQYHNGVIWVNIGPASTGAAVLLAAGTSIRFNPALDFVGSAPTLTAHLVDASAGAIVSGALADLSASGGTTPYSGGTVVLSQEVQNINDAPTGVTGTLSVHEFPSNGTAVGTLSGQDPDSSSFTYQLLNDAGGRFAMDSAGNVTVADGLLIDFEQVNTHAITVRVTDDMGASSDFVVNVSITDVLGENVTGDGRANYMVGGAESDTFNGVGGNDLLLGGGGSDTLNGGLGNDSLLGGAGSGDILLGGDGNDWLDGGAGSDTLTGGAGNDVFVFTKGEANGDVITDFFGRGNAQGDQIVLAGYGAGTTFTRVGNGSSNLYKIDDNGFIEFVTIYATGQVHGSDYDIITNYDYNFWW